MEYHGGGRRYKMRVTVLGVSSHRLTTLLLLLSIPLTIRFFVILLLPTLSWCMVRGYYLTWFPVLILLH